MTSGSHDFLWKFPFFNWLYYLKLLYKNELNVKLVTSIHTPQAPRGQVIGYTTKQSLNEAKILNETFQRQAITAWWKLSLYIFIQTTYTTVVFQQKLKNVASTVVLPHAASCCAQTRSLSCSHWLALSHTSHSIELAHAHYHLLALARTSHSLALASPPVGSYSLRTRSLTCPPIVLYSLTLTSTCSRLPELLYTCSPTCWLARSVCVNVTHR